MARVAGRIEMAAGGGEVSGFTAGRGDRVGVASAHRVDVQPVEAGGQYAPGDGLDGDCRVAVREIEGRVGDGFTIRRSQLGWSSSRPSWRSR